MNLSGWPPKARAILGWILRQCSRPSRRCWAKLGTIARCVGCSVRWVYEITMRAHQEGILSRERMCPGKVPDQSWRNGHVLMRWIGQPHAVGGKTERAHRGDFEAQIHALAAPFLARSTVPRLE